MDAAIKLKAFNPKVFRAYDIRGLYPAELDLNTVGLIARGFVEYLRRHAKGNFCLLGRDVRHSSEEILEEVREEFLKNGLDVLEVGMVTTPMLTFAMARSQADGGIMVTASHNSILYNGLKIYEGESPLSEKTGLKEIRGLIEKGWSESRGARGRLRRKNFLKDYVQFLKKQVDIKRKVKAVFDADGGAVGPVLEELLRGLNLEAIKIGVLPDPGLLAREPNPLSPQAQIRARAALLENKAEVGFIFDPDGDRVLVLDEKGEVLRGDMILWLLSQNYAKAGDGIVYDGRSSEALLEDLKSRNLKPVLSRVGHPFIKEAMREADAVLGGEFSGHFYFRDFFYSESALLTSLKILQILSKSEKSLSELILPYSRYFHSGEVNFAIKNKEEIFSELYKRYSDGGKLYLDGLTVKYPGWWFNIRASNTEDLVYVVLEARDKITFEQKKEELFTFLFSLGARLA